MEQTIWIYIGVLSFIIGIGIISTLFVYNEDSKNLSTLKRSMDRLENHCGFVCSAGRDTQLSVDVTLPAGAILSSEETKICATLNDEYMCRKCSCNILPFSLDLTDAIGMFKTHEYSCLFTKGRTNIEMECQG